ncbi:hypothetical protein [Streptomyces sp. SAI-097]
MSTESEAQQEYLRQDNLTYGGLTAVGLVFLPPFVAGTPLSAAARVSVIAFAAALPLLGALMLLNSHEAFRKREASTRLVRGAKAVAIFAALTGVVAGLWHITWIAGVTALALGLLATRMYVSGIMRLEYSGDSGHSGTSD